MSRNILVCILLFFASLSGCLGDEGIDHSNFEGCTGEEVEVCVTDTPEENITTNETTPDIGTLENQTLPIINSLGRVLNGTWQNWSSSDHFSGDGNWVLIQFAATDCGHCWNGAQLMSDLHANYGQNVTFLTFIINFSWSNSSLDEIAAFQDEGNFSGCNNDNNNCNERPGSPHDWIYVDDRDLSWLAEFQMTGTPSYVIVQPDGVVNWHHRQQGQNESIQDAMDRLFGPGA